MTNNSKAVFLDRDGVIIVDKHYLKDPAGVELIPHAKSAITDMLHGGYLLFLFTNQSGVSRGYYTMDDVNACNLRMLKLLDLPQPGFTEICVAPEAPNDVQVYRKPSPKFIVEMTYKYNLDKSNSWMLGDKIADIQAGIGGKINSAWINTGKPKDIELRSYLEKHGILEFSNLAEFSQHIITKTI